MRQSKNLASRLPSNIDVIYCSSLKRAQQTIAIALKEKGLDIEVVLDDGLVEMDLGDLEGLLRDELSDSTEVKWNKLMVDFDFKDHNGESRSEFHQRIVSTFEKIVLQANSNNHQNLIIVTHGGVLSILLDYHLRLATPPFRNTETITIEIVDDSWKRVEI